MIDSRLLCQLTTPAGVDFLRLTASEYRQAIYSRTLPPNETWKA